MWNWLKKLMSGRSTSHKSEQQLRDDIKEGDVLEAYKIEEVARTF